MVQRKRHLAKAISYRVLGSLTTFAAVLVMTEQLHLSIGSALIESVVKIIMYYAHERAWYRIKWGVVDEKE